MIATMTLGLALTAWAGEPAGGGDKKPVIVIQCRADADIRGAEVLLRDLADVRADDPELVTRLLSTSFGRRPAFGFSRVLSQQDILARLHREGLKSGRVKLAGATRVALHPIVHKPHGPRPHVEQLDHVADRRRVELGKFLQRLAGHGHG